MNDRNVIDTQWLVVTGAPSSGKTTTVDRLSEATGRPVRAEIATQVIRQRILTGMTLEEATADQHGLQLEIFHAGRESEDNLHHGHSMILDRGWPDVIAYEMLYGGGRHEAFLSLVRGANRRYQHVFRLEPLPPAENDVRVDNHLARELHVLYQRVYKELGYEVFDVPVLSVEERVQLMLRRV